MTTTQENKIRIELSEAHHDFDRALNARAFFKTHNHTTSDDLVQDTFIKTWSYLAKGGKIEIMKVEVELDQFLHLQLILIPMKNILLVNSVIFRIMEPVY